jgi:hypothetical protein
MTEIRQVTVGMGVFSDRMQPYLTADRLAAINATPHLRAQIWARQGRGAPRAFEPRNPVASLAR